MINKKWIKYTSMVLICVVGLSHTAGATTLIDKVEAKLKTLTLHYNQDQVTVEGLNYEGKTYIPIDEMANMLDIHIEEDTANEQVIMHDKSIEFDEDKILHGLYAISSYNQYNTFKDNKTLQAFDSISFGWAKITEDEQGEIFINTTSDYGNEFRKPDGSEELLRQNEERSIDSNLMVFADGYFDKILTDKTIIDMIVNLSAEFKGITIDFERIGSEFQGDYITFLEDLKSKLHSMNKKLYVAIPSPKWQYYDYKNIIDIADYVILMVHDYDVKGVQGVNVKDGVVYTPQTPLQYLQDDLQLITKNLKDPSQSKRILLQLNFSIVQWSVEEGKVTNKYTPVYSSLYDRMVKEYNKNKDSLETVMRYDEGSKNPYMVYEDNGVNYTIWYENETSIEEKLKLIDQYNLGGASIWRIGLIPHYYDFNDTDIDLDIWSTIYKAFRK